MSIILKGIDIPKDGESIRLVITSSGDVVEVWGDGLAKYHPSQAVQIPKNHGRIGDLDKLQNAIKTDIMGGLNYEYFIRNTPVILEAEGEE